MANFLPFASFPIFEICYEFKRTFLLIIIKPLKQGHFGVLKEVIKAWRDNPPQSLIPLINSAQVVIFLFNAGLL